MALRLTPDLIADINDWTHANKRAQLAYRFEPHSGTDWCVGCIYPAGSSRFCDNCAAARRNRRKRRAS